MDPPTHGLLGAVIGQAFFARRLGRGRALGFGAALNMLPDIDVVMVPLLGGLAEWRYHRTATHGLLVLPFVGLALGTLLWREHRASGGESSRATWVALALAALLAHPLADAFTSYGTVLFWPWPRRYAWDALPIVDLVFSGVLLLALVLGFVWRRHAGRAQAAACAALALLVAYEAYGLHLNRVAEREARRQAEVLKAQPDQVRAYPVLLLPWLRRVVVRQGYGLAVGWVSTWRPGPIVWHRLEVAHGPAVDAARRLEPVRMFEWFAMGQTNATVQPELRQIEIDDLRYGFPNDPRHGIWGVRARLTDDGQLAGKVERVRRPRPPAGTLVGWLWRATFRGEIE